MFHQHFDLQDTETNHLSNIILCVIERTTASTLPMLQNQFVQSNKANQIKSCNNKYFLLPNIAQILIFLWEVKELPLYYT